ncbi:hypothetical protein Tco_1351118 [Tanacetum coccineum]
MSPYFKANRRISSGRVWKIIAFVFDALLPCSRAVNVPDVSTILAKLLLLSAVFFSFLLLVTLFYLLSFSFLLLAYRFLLVDSCLPTLACRLLLAYSYLTTLACRLLLAYSYLTTLACRLLLVDYFLRLFLVCYLLQTRNFLLDIVVLPATCYRLCDNLLAC